MTQCINNTNCHSCHRPMTVVKSRWLTASDKPWIYMNFSQINGMTGGHRSVNWRLILNQKPQLKSLQIQQVSRSQYPFIKYNTVHRFGGLWSFRPSHCCAQDLGTLFFLFGLTWLLCPPVLFTEWSYPRGPLAALGTPVIHRIHGHIQLWWLAQHDHMGTLLFSAERII